jgi:hypothetical protein
MRLLPLAALRRDWEQYWQSPTILFMKVLSNKLGAFMMWIVYGIPARQIMNMH